MPYLSRVWINPRRRQARRLLGNPQAMHAAVLAGFPQQPVQDRILWRLDDDDPHRPALFVLSGRHPSWEHLVEQAGWPSAADADEPQAVVKPYEPLLERLRDGDEYAFRLTANPVRAARSRRDREEADATGNGRSKRRGCVTIEQQVAWLTNRASKLGFDIASSSAIDVATGEPAPDVRVIRRESRSFRKKGMSDRVTLRVVTYEGRLQVTDRDALAEALASGIGPAKAYGCGLMTLAPITS